MTRTRPCSSIAVSLCRVALLNRDTAAAPITVTWQQLDYPDHLAARIRDLLQAKDLGTVKASYTAVAPPHSVVMLKVQP